MALPLPPPFDLRFEWTVFANRYAIGSSRGIPQTVPYEYQNTTFSDYAAQCVTFSHQVVPKEKAPGIIHGKTNGFRGSDDVETCSALVLDYDGGDGVPGPIREYFEASGYFFQARHSDTSGKGGKWHLVIPFTKSVKALPIQILRRRRAAIDWLSAKFSLTLDPATAGIASFLHPYSLRVDTDLVPESVFVDGPGFDFDTFLGDIGYREGEHLSRPVKRTKKEATEESQVVLDSLADYYLEGPERPNGGRPIACPFEHSGQGDSSTVVYPDGRIKCLHASCVDRRQSEFLAKLVADGVSLNGRSPLLTLQLESLAGRKEYSVDDAAREMTAALETTHPFEATASVVRVSTGGGKTKATAEFLDRYCTPVWDPETGEITPGRSAVFGLPTNRLLREVEERLTVGHERRIGVLAVLNDNGTPACRKHADAMRLMEGGGDVHRQMCSGCEHHSEANPCPAIVGSRVGEGSLVITNHALVPSVVQSLSENGRIPLVVWDECPPVVETKWLSFKDLTWLIEAFDAESLSRPVLDGLETPPLFSDQYRVAYRPFVEVLRFMSLAESYEEAERAYLTTEMSRTQLRRSGATTARAAALGAEGFSNSERPFDQLQPRQQDVVLRAEGIKAVVDMMLKDRVRIRKTPGGLMVTATTAAGDIFRTRGGVIMDATAPLDDLRGIRPDLRLTDLSVQDAGRTVRVIKPCGDISRSRLKSYTDKRRKDVLDRLAADIREEVRFQRSRKVLVMTYRALMEDLKAAVANATWASGDSVTFDYAYFGNIRGYDQWFQTGFDTYITVGDPYSNIVAEREVFDYLRLGETDEEFQAYIVERTRGELSQCHGRARSPQYTRSGLKARYHLHYGKLPPMGWDTENTLIVERITAERGAEKYADPL